MAVIDSKSLERDAGEKPVPTFSHPALAFRLSRDRVATYACGMNDDNSLPAAYCREEGVFS